MQKTKKIQDFSEILTSGTPTHNFKKNIPYPSLQISTCTVCTSVSTIFTSLFVLVIWISDFFLNFSQGQQNSF